MKPITGSLVTADFQLPEAEVPELEFAGIAAQYRALKSEIAPRMAEVFSHGRFIMGPEVAELEGALAAYCGARHAITLSSGTDALVAPLMAHGVGRGDAVFVPGFTFTASAEVILLLGAHPVFVDVGSRSYNIDCDHLEERIAAVKREGRLKPKAVIAVDLFGLPADYDRLNAIAANEGMLLIADAAQSFGGARHNARVGTLAPVTATSFFPAKPFGCYGDGGAVFTDDDATASAIRSIRTHGQGDAKYEIVRVGLNARLDTLQAAVLLGKLPALDAEIAAREKLAAYYDEALDGVAETPERYGGHVSAWAQYSFLLYKRDAVQEQLKGAGIPTAVYYPRPMHLQPAYESFGEGEGSLPVSESLCSRILSLPMHGYMEQRTAERIAGAVRDAVARINSV